MRNFGVTLANTISVEKVYRLHYVEYTPDYSVEVELQNFWGFSFVSRGEGFVAHDDERLVIKRNQLFLHPPHSKFTIGSNGPATNLIMAYFSTDDELLAEFYNQVVTPNADAKQYMMILIKEAKYAFDVDFKNPNYDKLERSADQMFGSEQMIRTLLEQFIICVYRREKLAENKNYLDIVREVVCTTHIKNDDTFNKCLEYLENNINKIISIEELSREFHVSPSYIKKLFKKVSNTGVIDYHNRMKIEYAKILIRETSMNFSEISDCVGYGSVQYFSRIFKRLLGMSPSEYALFIKS